MNNLEWIEMLRVIPIEQQNELVLVLKNGSEIAVDTFFRFEPNFLVLRGRVGGTTDEGRGFFVPYEQMLYYRIERVVNIAHLGDIMGEEAAKLEPIPAPAPTPTPAVVPNVVPEKVEAVPAPVTDATATRNAILDRIRAARVTQNASSVRQATEK